MKCAVLLVGLVALLAVVVAQKVPSNEIEMKREFLQFQKRFNKTYSDKQELVKRFEIFKTNFIKARELETQHNGKAKFGVTKFSDLSAEEFKAAYLMNVPKDYVKPAPHSRDNVHHAINVSPNPTNYDWDSAGVITPIYNQGQCGSCWAFSATETIESYWALAGHKLSKLSMEQIVDCDPNDSGCDGGWPYLAYQYVQSAGGIDSYSSYPYTAGNGVSGNCQFSSSNIVAKVTGYKSISGETDLYKQLSSPRGGPVSVCVDASSWQYYNGGVLQTCGNDVDHCVQLVGYANYNKANAYWIVRNSWGADWGENGFIWIAIGQDLCSIGDYATVVTV